MTRYTIAKYLVNTWLTLFMSFLAYMFLVYLPAGLYAQGKCLEEGYPKYHITWDLKQYCSTDMGTVVVRK